MYKCQGILFSWDVTRSRGTRSRRFRCVTWWYPCKTFCSVYIRAAPLIVKKLRSCFKHPRNLFPEWERFSYVYCDCFTLRVSVECEKHVLSLPMLMNQRVGHHHAVIHWYGRRQNMRWSSSSDAYDVKQVLNTFKSAFMLLLIQKEQHSLFNHTSVFLCYRHLNIRSNRDAPNVRQPKSRNGLKRLVLYY